ncbi:MAG: diphosphate--fructose-6-phosphate 1-phosphotransferase [Candidatus Margulisbacteria bacterium]|nr:diphosphate--fructose-6-phosphate 1-phosphotransferase [Candidatus Margulisiibacteriota bacterium]
MVKDLLMITECHNSLFEQEIRNREIPVCKVFFQDGVLSPISFEEEGTELYNKDTLKVNEVFKNSVAASGNKVLKAKGPNPSPKSGLNVAVLFSGGPAAGGHNVVVGLKKILGNSNTLYGIKAGPKGLLKGDLFEVTEKDIASIINTGGFGFLGSDRTKIKTDEQFEMVKSTCKKYALNAIVVIGGDDSNTNAALLAEYLYDMGVQVIGCPKTIDGDLQVGDLLPISFGFDTATKIYAELVGNILQDTPSSRKYWHFIKLMGRSASHVALEVALQTKPAVCLISEEIEAKNMSLDDIINSIAKVVVTRSKKGINYGVVLIPEGIIEFIPEMKTLVAELNEKIAEFSEILANKNREEKRDFIYQKLSATNTKLMASLPDYIEDMLLTERDSHGNLQVSLIPTERLIIEMVHRRVKEMDFDVPFHQQQHFFGYEGRCGAPTLFDATYTYNLGLTAGSLILAGKTGYIASVTSFDTGMTVLGIPLTGLLNVERRHCNDEMVIEKALVKLDSPAFQFFESRREDWATQNLFNSPGPMQLWGPSAKQMPMTVALNRGYKTLNFDY